MPRFINRRRFLLGVGAAIAGTGTYAYGIEPHRVAVVCRDLPIKNLSANLCDETLVQISDLHVGPTGEDYLLDCFSLVEQLGPQLIVITGDFMTGRGTELVMRVGTLLSQLERPPLGVFATLGNHDYGPTWADRGIAEELVPAIRNAGVVVLRNEVADAGGLQVIGMDELWASQFQPQRAFAGYDPKQAAIVLSHNPDTLDRPGWGNYQGWVLSGHTHGGQCKLPFFQPPFIPVANPRYTAGEIDLGDGRRVYINRGLGYNRRVRFNVRPETTAFTLRQEA